MMGNYRKVRSYRDGKYGEGKRWETGGVGMMGKRSDEKVIGKARRWE